MYVGRYLASTALGVWADFPGLEGSNPVSPAEAYPSGQATGYTVAPCPPTPAFPGHVPASSVARGREPRTRRHDHASPGNGSTLPGFLLATPIGSATLGLAQLRGPNVPGVLVPGVCPRCLSHTQMPRCCPDESPPSQSSVSSFPPPLSGPHLSPASQQPSGHPKYCAAPAWATSAPRYMAPGLIPARFPAPLLMNPLPPSSSANLASSCHSPSHSPSLRLSSFSLALALNPVQALSLYSPAGSSSTRQQVGQFTAVLHRDRSPWFLKRCFGSVGSYLPACWSLSSL